VILSTRFRLRAATRQVARLAEFAGGIIKCIGISTIYWNHGSFYRKIDLSEESTAADIIADVSFDGNYVTAAHTLDHCMVCIFPLYQPFINPLLHHSKYYSPPPGGG
jgi:hypothetical protein